MAAIRRMFEVILMLVGLFALPVVWMKIHDNGLKSRVDPPWSVQTLADFRKWRPQYDRAIKLESGGAVYYLIFGEKARVLASGPSGYVFDSRGNFVGWILDTGDDTYLRVAVDNDARRGTLSAAQIVTSPAPPSDPKK